jgi:hypothetical protein
VAKQLFSTCSGRRWNFLDSPNEKELSNICNRFGTIAVKKGFITEDQLKAAMMEQLEDNLYGRDHRIIGAILYKKGWITYDQVDVVLKELFKENIEKMGHR